MKDFAYCHQKAWNNEFKIKLWISEVWRKYFHFEFQKDTMFIIDDASLNKIENIQQKIKDCGTKISMIQGNLIKYLQPFDISINKPF